MLTINAIPHSKIRKSLASPTKRYSIVWCCGVATYAMLLVAFGMTLTWTDCNAVSTKVEGKCRFCPKLLQNCYNPQ